MVINTEKTENIENNFKSDFHRNRIIFGAPGTGKSFLINNERKSLLSNGGEYERVTFHPDYSYAQFVGTYKPTMIENVQESGPKTSSEISYSSLRKSTAPMLPLFVVDALAELLDNKNGRCDFSAYQKQVTTPIAECLSTECEEGIRTWLLTKKG